MIKVVAASSLAAVLYATDAAAWTRAGSFEGPRGASHGPWAGDELRQWRLRLDAQRLWSAGPRLEPLGISRLRERRLRRRRPGRRPARQNL